MLRRNLMPFGTGTEPDGHGCARTRSREVPVPFFNGLLTAWPARSGHAGRFPWAAVATFLLVHCGCFTSLGW